MDTNQVRSVAGYVCAFAVIAFALWLAMNAAGTVWSIPFAAVISVVALVMVRVSP
jgi:hypothetical protein